MVPTSEATSWLVVDERVVASVEVAATRAARRRGLLGRADIEGAMLISPARSVHSFGMRFALDVAFIDRSGTVIALVAMPPGRVTRPRWRATGVIEARCGAFGRWGVGVGDTVEIRS